MAPIMSAYVGFGHLEHSVCPEDSEKKCFPQSIQVEAPGFGPNVPVGQLKQFVVFPNPNFPAGQVMHWLFVGRTSPKRTGLTFVRV